MAFVFGVDLVLLASTGLYAISQEPVGGFKPKLPGYHIGA